MDENENDPHVILLDSFKKRMEFPELKDTAFRYYKEWEPDACVIEAKAAGAPLIFELRRMGVYVRKPCHLLDNLVSPTGFGCPHFTG